MRGLFIGPEPRAVEVLLFGSWWRFESTYVVAAVVRKSVWLPTQWELAVVCKGVWSGNFRLDLQAAGLVWRNM